MLVYLFTDVAAESRELRELLEPAAEASFNSISIDGDTSTNDTVLLLASGGERRALDERTRPAFQSALAMVCGSLAHQIVDDGEGVRHVVTLEITGARDRRRGEAGRESDRAQPAEQDGVVQRRPQLGQAAGCSGILGRCCSSPERVTIRIGDQVVFENGMRAATFDEAAAHRSHERSGSTRSASTSAKARPSCTFLTCDLTEEYVRINADYST